MRAGRERQGRGTAEDRQRDVFGQAVPVLSSKVEKKFNFFCLSFGFLGKKGLTKPTQSLIFQGIGGLLRTVIIFLKSVLTLEGTRLYIRLINGGVAGLNLFSASAFVSLNGTLV